MMTELRLSTLTSTEIREEGIEEGRLKGREEGRQEGREESLIGLVCKKLAKGKSVPEIAEVLEEDEKMIQNIVSVAEPFAPEYDINAILATWKAKQG